MKKLKRIKVTTPHHVELMRVIYNENIDMLSTHKLLYRTYEEQQAWWLDASKHSVAYLYQPYSKPGKYVAFLLLRKRDGFSTPTIAIQEEEWGSKYGQEIVQDYIKLANGPLAGSQLQINKKICHINEKFGWKIIGEQGEGELKIDLLYHPGVNKHVQCSREIFSNILSYLKISLDKCDTLYSKFIL